RRSRAAGLLPHAPPPGRCAPKPGAVMLPALRPDLQLSPAAPGLDGAPQWTLADPLRGRYFKLGAAAVRLLRHWLLGDPQRVLAAANAEPGVPLNEADLDELLRFLGNHDLISALDDT